MTFSYQKSLLYGTGLAIIIEGITALFRFGLHLESTRDTATTIGRLTGGFRIHHGYVGAVILFIAIMFLARNPRLKTWLFAIGFGLLFSDLIHHFLVLWPITGSPEFDLFYPRN